MDQSGEEFDYSNQILVMNDLRIAWIEQVLWTRAFIVSKLEELPNLDTYDGHAKRAL